MDTRAFVPYKIKAGGAVTVIAGDGLVIRQQVQQMPDVHRALFALQRRMASEPLPFLPKSGYAFVGAKDEDAGLKAAAGEWRGGWRKAGERSAATALALRGREPFVDGGHEAEQAFATLARAVFDALLHADPSGLEALR